MNTSALAPRQVPALLLAAGRGERMRPLTDTLPKPCYDYTGLSRSRAFIEKLTDNIKAVGIDACDAAPEHWRHVGNRIAAGMPFRPYGRDRHAAWLRRRAIEA